MKRIHRIVLCLLAAGVLFWGVCVAKCEWLTHRYGSEFAEGYTQTHMIDGIESFKVLKCTPHYAEVYYITAEWANANVVEFQKVDDGWEMDSWRTVWSASGSASNVIWPYFWDYLVYVLI